MADVIDSENFNCSTSIKDRKQKIVDVIIPVYRPDISLQIILKRLDRQSVKPNRIILINTEKRFWKPELIQGVEHVEVHHVKKAEFNHAATRRMAAELSDAEYMMFLTQDALPADNRLIERLLGALQDTEVAGAFARQLPRKNCNPIECYTRAFNYPEKSFVRTKEDIAKMGIRAYFFSDVCAVYRKADYVRLGGFVEQAIFNEDMLFAAKALEYGKKMAYVAEAKVYHSHNYGNIQYLRRNFDLGVSQAEHPEIFEAVSSEKEGIKLVKQTALYLIRAGKGYYIPKLISNSGFKWFGYKLGKNYQHIPRKVIRKLTTNLSYWNWDM